MYTWNYGSVLKYKTEVKDTISLDLLHDLGPNLGTVRVQGIGLLYTELVQGIPSIFVQFLLSLQGSNIGSPFEVRRSSKSSHNVEGDQATPDD
ncbi:Putative potassium transporter 12 [Trifolium repens]|nr:Putative potassium transporter 12 [Trifolium repens]